MRSRSSSHIERGTKNVRRLLAQIDIQSKHLNKVLKKIRTRKRRHYRGDELPSI